MKTSPRTAHCLWSDHDGFTDLKPVSVGRDRCLRGLPPDKFPQTRKNPDKHWVLSDHMSGFLFYLSVCISIRLPVSPSVCLILYPSLHPFVSLFICFFNHLSVYVNDAFWAATLEFADLLFKIKACTCAAPTFTFARLQVSLMLLQWSVSKRHDSLSHYHNNSQVIVNKVKVNQLIEGEAVDYLLSWLRINQLIEGEAVYYLLSWLRTNQLIEGEAVDW